MSKIEAALEKARSLGTLRPGAKSSPASQLVPSSVAATPAVKQLDPDIRVSSSHEIARMDEPWELNKADLAESKIICPDIADHSVVNAFREVRTKILRKSNGRNCILMVSSTSSNAGNSFVALNLAVAFSFDESKTALLLDCNLEKPSYQDLISTEVQYGLTDYLSKEKIDVNQIIHPIGIRRLRLIPTGCRSNEVMEYFTSTKISQLFADIKQRYQDRYIIIDAPPIADSADAHILSELCDHVILVVPYGRTTEAQIRAATKAVPANKLMGVVFNNEPSFHNAIVKKNKIWKNAV
jgi:exopolysaccharide/PEP-CTERM locus tyrosine autokinase